MFATDLLTIVVVVLALLWVTELALSLATGHARSEPRGRSGEGVDA